MKLLPLLMAAPLAAQSVIPVKDYSAADPLPWVKMCQGLRVTDVVDAMQAIGLPVVVGGVLVRPGDTVVADGGDVVVVPREQAERVAEIAWPVAKGDKGGPKKPCEKMGMPLDEAAK